MSADRPDFRGLAREAVKECASDCACVGEYVCCLHAPIARLAQEMWRAGAEWGLDAALRCALDTSVTREERARIIRDIKSPEANDAKGGA